MLCFFLLLVGMSYKLFWSTESNFDLILTNVNQTLQLLNREKLKHFTWFNKLWEPNLAIRYWVTGVLTKRPPLAPASAQRSKNSYAHLVLWICLHQHYIQTTKSDVTKHTQNIKQIIVFSFHIFMHGLFLRRTVRGRIGMNTFKRQVWWGIFHDKIVLHLCCFAEKYSRGGALREQYFPIFPRTVCV